MREIREELGVPIVVEDIFEVVFHRYEWGPVLILAYKCRLNGIELHNIGVAEHCWVEPGALKDYKLLPADGPIAERLARLKK